MLTFGVATFYGKPLVQHHKKYVEPRAFLSFRMGWHTCLGGDPQVIEQYDSLDQSMFGEAILTIKYHGPQTVSAKGQMLELFGRPVIEYLNRIVKPLSWISTSMGRSNPGESVYKPQGLWVGKPMPTIPKGYNAEIFGDTIIGLRVRGINVQGFNSFISEMDILGFKGRMKVELVQKSKEKESRGILVQSFDQGVYGIPDIRLKTHYIRPDGNSDQYRKGILE